MSRSATHYIEAHGSGDNARLNWLRAGVLGANDGVVAVSSLVLGVAAAGADHTALLMAGMAGLVSGALSMGVGEYVSVSTQRDTEAAMVELEKRELAEFPDEELDELTQIYQDKGLDAELARQVAVALTEHDALAAHAESELGIDHEEFTSPWQAAGASILAFVVGALLPLLTILLLDPAIRIPATVVAAAAALAVTGYVSAKIGKANRGKALLRNVLGGLAAMGITYLIGAALGTQVG